MLGWVLVGFSKLKKVLGLGLVGFVPFSEKYSVGVSRFWQYFQKVKFRGFEATFEKYLVGL